MRLDHTQSVPRKPVRTAVDDQFMRDVLDGLTKRPKSLPSKYFYDTLGSELFERITQTPEYYLTRCEAALLHANANEIMQGLGNRAAIVEFGAGSSLKMEPMLAHTPEGATFIPLDVSASALRASEKRLAARFPHLVVRPLVGDFSALSAGARIASQREILAFFLGSTIGNFAPEDAIALLSQWKHVLGPGARLIVGADLVKDREILERAYNDAAGITAAFNINILRHINQKVGPAFDLSKFEHLAFFNERESRVEMHLKSTRRQRIDLGGVVIGFDLGETVQTENSYKYSLASLATLGAQAGWTLTRSWTDGWFIVQELRPS